VNLQKALTSKDGISSTWCVIILILYCFAQSLVPIHNRFVPLFRCFIVQKRGWQFFIISSFLCWRVIYMPRVGNRHPTKNESKIKMAPSVRVIDIYCDHGPLTLSCLRKRNEGEFKLFNRAWVGKKCLSFLLSPLSPPTVLKQES